jgi:hypothetical protein
MAYTPLWGTGFEMGSKEIVVSADITVAIETTTKHTGAYSLRIYGAPTPDGLFQIALDEAQSELYVSAWLRASSDSEAPSRFEFVTSDGYRVGLRNDAAYWDAVVNGTTMAQGATSAAGGEWHLVELYVSISNTGAIQSKIDGVADIDYSGDTQPGAGTTIAKVEFRQEGSVSHNPYLYVDDITIATGDWIGDVRYDAALVPTADTAVKGWTPSTGADNYALLDELPPSDTDYVSSGSAGAKDLYEMSNWTPAVSTYEVQFIVDWIRAKKDVAGDQQIRSVIKSGSTESSGGSIDLSTTYRYYGRILATDPDTAAAWDEAGIDTLLGGQEYL